MSYRTVIYTHSDYFDAYRICIQQEKKFYDPIFMERIKKGSVESYIPFITLSNVEQLDDYVLYDESLSYSKRLFQALSKIKDRTILLKQEDMILYGTPDFAELEQKSHLIEDGIYDFIKLISTNPIGNRIPNQRNLVSLKYNPYYFAIQPTLWNREKLLEFLGGLDCSTPSELESRHQERCREMLRGVSWFSGNEKLRGEAHYDSLVYPYIATAIVGGKWNMKEYSKELRQLFKEHGFTGNRLAND